MSDDRSEVRERRAQGRAPRAPRRIMLQVTNLCDSRCTMCHIWRIYPEDKALAGQELTADEWRLVVTNALRQGVRHIDVTGGEPFLKDGLVELLALILGRLGFTSVVTNALRPGPIVEQLRRVLESAPLNSNLDVYVSIDGFRETNAELRGRAEGFDRSIELLRELNRLRASYPQLTPNVSFTVQEPNFRQMGALLDELLSERLIDSPERFAFRPVQGSFYFRKENALTGREAVIEEIERVQSTHSFGRNGAFIEGIKASLREPGRMLLPCYALFASCWIDPYGNVSPCVTMTDEPLGNLRETGYDLLPVWESEAADLARRRIKEDRCPVCWTDCQAHENLSYQ